MYSFLLVLVYSTLSNSMLAIVITLLSRLAAKFIVDS